MSLDNVYPIQEKVLISECMDGLADYIRSHGLICCQSLKCIFNNKREGCYLAGAAIKDGKCIHYNPDIDIGVIFPLI